MFLRGWRLNPPFCYPVVGKISKQLESWKGALFCLGEELLFCKYSFLALCYVIFSCLEFWLGLLRGFRKSLEISGGQMLVRILGVIL